MFTDITGKPVCLICVANGAIIKECNQRHYRTKHQGLQNLNAEQKRQKVAVKEDFHQRKRAKSTCCRMKVGDVLCPGKKQTSANVSQSRTTVADGLISEMATDLKAQLSERSTLLHAVAVDELTRWTLHIRPSSSAEWTPVCVLHRKYWTLKSIHATRTRNEDIFFLKNVGQIITDMKLPWDKLIGLITDGASAMCSGEKVD